MTPCSTTSGSPPASLATTGVSQPMASAAGMPKPSSNDGITDTRRGAVVRRQLGVRHPAEERDVPRDAQPLGQRDQLGPLEPVARHHDLEVGKAGLELRGGLDQEANTLAREELAAGEDHVGAEPRGPLGAGRRRAEPPEIGAVEDEVHRLGRAPRPGARAAGNPR